MKALFIIAVLTVSQLSWAAELRIGSVAASRAGSWTLDGSYFSATRSKLLAATEADHGFTLSIQDFSASLDTVDLIANVDVLFIGYVSDAKWSEAELNAIGAFVDAGGKVWANCDDVSHDAVCEYFGLAASNHRPASVALSEEGANHPIYEGPFGAGEPSFGGGSYTEFAVSNPNATVLTRGAGGDAFSAVVPHGEGIAVLFGDVDIFSSYAGAITDSSPGFSSNSYERLLGNLMAWFAGESNVRARLTNHWKLDGSLQSSKGPIDLEAFGSTGFVPHGGVSGDAFRIGAQGGGAMMQSIFAQFANGPFSVSLWIKYENHFVGHARHEHLITSGWQFGPEGEIQRADRAVDLFAERDGSRGFAWVNGSGTQQIWNGPVWTLQKNQWHHIVIGRDGDNQYVCQNGELVVSAPMNEVFDHSLDVRTYIGREPYSGRSFPGSFDEIQVYDGWIGSDGCAALHAEPGKVLGAEEPLPTVEISLSREHIYEDPARRRSSSAITATLSEVYSQDLVIDFALSGDATPGLDFTLPQLVVPAGALSASVELTAIEDAENEPVETAVLSYDGADYSVAIFSKRTRSGRR